MTSPADEVRRLTARYNTNPARTRAALDAALNPERAEAVLAVADFLDGLGLTAEDIEQGIAEGGSIRVSFARDDGDGA